METLSSLKFALWSLVTMIVWLGAGVALGGIKSLAPHFKAMDQTLIVDWLLGPAWQMPMVPLWFLGLCLAVGVMLTSLAACTLTRLLPRLRGGSRFKGWLLTLVHLIMLLVLVGHLAEMGLGHKHEGLRLLPGQAHQLPDGLSLRLVRLDFADDKAILNRPYGQARWVLTREAFHRQDNRLLVELDDGRSAPRQAELAILEPLLAQGYRLTLTDFFRDDSQPGAPVGAAITVARNPLTPLFFGAYGLWIILYGVLAWATWQRPGATSPLPEPALVRAG